MIKEIFLSVPLLFLPIPSLAHYCDIFAGVRAPSKFDDLLNNLTIPRTEFNPGSSLDEMASALDQYFKDLIAVYPVKTRIMLNAMYFKGAQVKYLDGQFEQNSLGNWYVNGDPNDLNAYTISIDSRLKGTKLLAKWTLIHEIAIHVGQYHSYINRVGIEQSHRDIEYFQQATEMSAALTEWEFMIKIPLYMILADAVQNMPSQEWAELLSRNTTLRYTHVRDSYVRLGHRKSTIISAELADRLMARWEFRR